MCEIIGIHLIWEVWTMSVSRIVAQVRDGSDKKGKVLRREGYVPAVIYGHKDTTKNIKINNNEIRNLISHHGTKAKLNISLQNKNQSVFIKDVQKDVLTGDILSIDFQILYKDEVVKIEVPISFHNAGLITEFILTEDLNSIEIEALPKYLPERITIDLEGINPDKPIKVTDLEISKDPNIRVLTDLDALVASAHFKKELVEEIESEEEEEPELIGSDNEEEE